MRWLVDEAYPETPVVPGLVMDNLNTHRPASLYDRQRPVGRLEFHYTPKHGSG